MKAIFYGGTHHGHILHAIEHNKKTFVWGDDTYRFERVLNHRKDVGLFRMDKDSEFDATIEHWLKLLSEPSLFTGYKAKRKRKMQAHKPEHNYTYSEVVNLLIEATKKVRS